MLATCTLAAQMLSSPACCAQQTGPQQTLEQWGGWVASLTDMQPIWTLLLLQQLLCSLKTRITLVK